MKVSVIIPCKNRLNHLKETLPLVMGQSYSDFEVLVIDYNCPQRSGEYSEKMGATTVYCDVAPNEWSLSAARNQGYFHAKGEMLLFLDADAVLSDPDFIAKHVNYCVDGSFICGWGVGEATGCCMLRKRAFEAADGYNELIKSWGAEDIRFYQRLEGMLAQERRNWLGGITCLNHGDEFRNEYHGGINPAVTDEENFKIKGYKGISPCNLYILTSLFRFENVDKIAQSIPYEENITWVISKSSQRENIKITHPRAKVIELDIEDNAENAIHKYEAMRKAIGPGFFMVLDDDNVFTKEMYGAFLSYRYEYNMIIGQMLRYDGSVYLNAHIPECGKIDAGNVLCRSSAGLANDFHNLKQYDCPDGMFWKRCYDYFKGQKILLLNEPIAKYNALR